MKLEFIFNHDEVLAAWAARNIPHMHGIGFGPCKAIGVGWPDPEHGYRVLAAAVYHDMRPELGTCMVSIAAVNPRWAQRGIIRALLSYPFEQLGVHKLWSLMPIDNKRAIKFNKGIGFKQEATLRHQFGKGRHAVFASMIAKEYHKFYGEGRILKAKPRKMEVPPNVINFPVAKQPHLQA